MAKRNLELRKALAAESSCVVQFPYVLPLHTNLHESGLAIIHHYLPLLTSVDWSFFTALQSHRIGSQNARFPRRKGLKSIDTLFDPAREAQATLSVTHRSRKRSATNRLVKTSEKLYLPRFNATLKLMPKHQMLLLFHWSILPFMIATTIPLMTTSLFPDALVIVKPLLAQDSLPFLFPVCQKTSTASVVIL